MGQVSRKLKKYIFGIVLGIALMCGTKSYAQYNRDSQIIIAQVRALLANAPISPNDNMHLLDEEYVIAEYDEAHERIVQSDFICREKIASNIMENLNANGGILFIVDKTK